MTATNAVTLLVGFSLTAFCVLIPGFLKVAPAERGYGFGASPTEAGLMLLPFSVAMVVGGPLGLALGTRHGCAVPLRIGVALGAASPALLAGLHGTSWLVAAWLPVMGCEAAFALAAIGALVIDHSRPEESAVSGAMNSIMRTAGAACGAQLAAAILSARTARRRGPPARGRLHYRPRDRDRRARRGAGLRAAGRAPPTAARVPAIRHGAFARSVNQRRGIGGRSTPSRKHPERRSGPVFEDSLGGAHYEKGPGIGTSRSSAFRTEPTFADSNLANRCHLTVQSQLRARAGLLTAVPLTAPTL